MPDPFLEERLSVAIEYGSAFGDDYAVEISRTQGGKEYRRLVHPWPMRRFTVRYQLEIDELWSDVMSLYHRVFGRFAGFRVKALDDFSTNGMTGVPGAADQFLPNVSAGVYQLQKEYGTDSSTVLDIGRPARTIFKPVAGTVRLSVRNGTTGDSELTNVGATRWAVDTTTGLVTLAANKTKAITSISNAVAVVIGVGAGHGFVVGDSAHVSGVVGMTEINSLRAAVTAIGADTITLNIDSSGFAAYVSGGTVNTWPQSGEEMRGGCEFDIPCRFDSVLDIGQTHPRLRELQQVELLELIAL
jgi:uncharacterized protein (TIGR02217 family)